jgi:hypothetical protein
VFDRQTGSGWLAAESAHAAQLEAQLGHDLQTLDDETDVGMSSESSGRRSTCQSTRSRRSVISPA